MKKIFGFIMVALGTAAIFTACNKSSDVKLTSQLDSLNYAYGVANGYGIKQFAQRMDTTGNGVEEITKGFKETFKNLSETKRAYYQGIRVGYQFNDQMKSGFFYDDSTAVINKDLINKNLFDALKGLPVSMTEDKASNYFRQAIMAHRSGKTPATYSKGQLDSLNIAFGIINGIGIRNYVLGSDTTNADLKAMIKGMKSVKNNPSNLEQLYAKGLEIGAGMYKQITEKGLANDSSLKANTEIVKSSLLSALKGDSTLMTAQEAQSYFETYMQKIQDEKLLSEFGDNKKAGESFLAKNAKNDGVITTASGLQYKVIKQGKGVKPAATDKVKVNYTGKLIDGTVFDSNTKSGKPVEFVLNQVIPGWTEGIQLMPVGSTYEFYIPQELAYGKRNMGSIKPFSTLIFDVDLLGIDAPEKK